MKIIFSFIIILISLSANSSDLEIIELHESKSLDQLVIDQINQDKKKLNNLNNENSEAQDNNVESEPLEDGIEAESLENNVDEELVLLDEYLLNNSDPNFIKNVLSNSNNIKITSRMDTSLE